MLDCKTWPCFFFFAGCEYKADISEIDFKPDNMGYMNDSHDINTKY